MNTNEIFEVIESIAMETSKNVKIDRIKANIGDEEFCNVLAYAYDPFLTFGIQQLPPANTGTGSKQFDEVTWGLLDSLALRRLTGNDAREAVEREINKLFPESSELLRRIIRKDLRAGFSASTINKAKKNLIKEIPYMRCSLPKDANLDEWSWAEGVYSQEKADGMFINVSYEKSGIVLITSRQGSEFPIDKFGKLVSEVKDRLTNNYQYHGEVVVMRDGVICERQIGNGILNSVLSGGDFGDNETPVFMVWDKINLISAASKGKCATPYRTRFNELLNQLRNSSGDSIVIIPTRLTYSLQDALLHYRELLKLGKEGTVIKHPELIWKDGTSKDQIKLKMEIDVDLKIVAIIPGRDGTKNEGRAGSLTCESSCGGLRVDVTVKNEAMRNFIDTTPNDWIGKVIVVRANSIMYPSDSNASYSLFLPRMVESWYRVDKVEADDLEDIISQFQSAVKGN